MHRAVGILRLALGPLVAATTWRFWAYAVVGGALVMPYVMLGTVVATVIDPAYGRLQLLPSAMIFCCVLPAVAATGFAIPAVQRMESAVVAELLQIPRAELTPSDRSALTRVRTATWFTAHLGVGALLSGISLALPPAAALAIAGPFVSEQSWQHDLARFREAAGGAALSSPLAPVYGVAALLLLAYLVVVANRLARWSAPRLLGPTASERLVALERRTEQLLEHRRLARELHDSVGHALSVVTLQAGAAGRVLDVDPTFARNALTTIEEQARAALVDLDHVLGVLRAEQAPESRRPERTLADLDELVRTTRESGLNVETSVSSGCADLPATLSREAYRIVQEGLTNALRHADPVRASVRVDVGEDQLVVEVTSPLSTETRRSPRIGGRGLYGVQERVALLGGTATAGPDGCRWLLSATLPTRPTIHSPKEAP